jgi:hypothetical protein
MARDDSTEFRIRPGRIGRGQGAADYLKLSVEMRGTRMRRVIEDVPAIGR